MTEADDQRKFILWCARQGYFARKVVSVGSKGWPDLFCGNPATRRCMLLELKADGGRVGAHQTQTAKLLRRCGVIVGVAYSLEEAKIQAAAFLGPGANTTSK